MDEENEFENRQVAPKRLRRSERWYKVLMCSLALSAVSLCFFLIRELFEEKEAGDGGDEQAISHMDGCTTIQGAESFSIFKDETILGTPIRRAPKRGFSSIIVPTLGSDMSVSLLIRGEENWQATEKNQTVVFVNSDESFLSLDFSPNLKILPDRVIEKATRILLIIRMPLDIAEQISIQPMLDPEFPQVSQINFYRVRPTTSGLSSPFEFLELGIEPEFIIPETFSKRLDSIDAGSLFVPELPAQRFSVNRNNFQSADLSKCSQSQEEIQGEN